MLGGGDWSAEPGGLHGQEGEARRARARLCGSTQLLAAGNSLI